METIKNDPWSTLVSGAQAPRALLADAVRETAPPAQRRKTAAPGRPDPGHSATPLSPDGQNPPAGSPLPDLPRSTHDRSDAPRFDAHEGHPPPFAPIAGDHLPPHAAASPLGPFPGAAAVSRAFEAAQDAPAFPTDSFPAFSSAPASADELAELAAKIERILTDEARRHGIDV